MTAVDAPRRSHLFLVHSHITYIVARAVVAKRGLDPAQVVFLTARGFSPPPNELGSPQVRLVPFEFTLVPRRRKDRPTMLQGWRTLAAIDRLLSEATGGWGFHFYTPQTMEHIAQVIKNSPACNGFSFIEEGLYSYCTREEMDGRHTPRKPRLWECLAYRNRIRPSSFFDPCNAQAYGVHEAVFPGMQGRVVLEHAFPPLADPAMAEGVSDVLVFDSLAVYGHIQLDSLLTVLGRLLTLLQAQGIEHLHYKFHPAQLGTPEQVAIEAVLQDAGFPVQRLPAPISLEGLALAPSLARPDGQTPIRWFVSLSSVGLYAALFGCPVYSFAPWIAEIEPEFQRIIDQTPAVFGRYVRDISEMPANVGGGLAHDEA
jgi:hypothetical protein